MKKIHVLILFFLVLAIDQFSKLYIKTHFRLGEEVRIFDWFILHFTENPGMAFGMEWGGSLGKMLLTLFRLIVVGFGIYFVNNAIKTKMHSGFIACATLILAGAMGNLVDGLFYGMIFTDSLGRVAEFMPAGGGYAGFMGGYVVDMLYFPLWQGILPNWIPVKGGDYFVFFSPVFNVADSAITVGIFIILIFQKSFFPEQEVKNEESSVTLSKNKLDSNEEVSILK